MKTNYLLIALWTEPEQGSIVYTCNLTLGAYKKIKDIIQWLETKAGDNYGHTLPRWHITPLDTPETPQLTGLQETIEEIKLQSRYNETDAPGEYYGGKCPLFYDQSNLIAINLEDMKPIRENKNGWFAYFKTTPTETDLLYAGEQITHSYSFIDKKREIPNELSKNLEIKRYFIANHM